MSRSKCYGKGPDKEALRNNFIFPDDDEKVVIMSLAAISEAHIKRKNFLIMRDIISVYHPDFLSGECSVSYGLRKPDTYNITRLVEECLAEVGPYEHIDEYGYDFTDYSDSKTATVSTYDKSLTIGNVQNKIGALRIVAYNPHTDTLDYFYLPKSAVAEYRERHTKNKDRIRTAWTEKTDSYNFFQIFRYYSFETMALAGHEQMIEDQNNGINDTSLAVSDIESVEVSSKQIKMKVTKQYTIEELNKMSAQVAKKKATAQGIPRTPHPPQSEFTHPICITASCTNPKAVNDWHWTSGLPVYKDICIKCHNKAVAGKHGLTRISQVVAKNKATVIGTKMASRDKSKISYSTS